jgi:hypothetical protein
MQRACHGDPRSGIGGGCEEAEAEVAGEAEGDRTAQRLREAQFEHATKSVGLNETTLAAEAVEVQRA